MWSLGQVIRKPEDSILNETYFKILYSLHKCIFFNYSVFIIKYFAYESNLIIRPIHIHIKDIYISFMYMYTYTHYLLVSFFFEVCTKSKSLPFILGFYERNNPWRKLRRYCKIILYYS